MFLDAVVQLVGEQRGPFFCGLLRRNVADGADKAGGSLLLVDQLSPYMHPMLAALTADDAVAGVEPVHVTSERLGYLDLHPLAIVGMHAVEEAVEPDFLLRVVPQQDASACIPLLCTEIGRGLPSAHVDRFERQPVTGLGRA